MPASEPCGQVLLANNVTVEIETSILVGICGSMLAFWWGMAKVMIGQFERRQDERFNQLVKSIADQKAELDTHMTRQDSVMGEIRRVETELARCQIEAAARYQTKAEASSQHGQIINEIRALGVRIDSLHPIIGRNGSQ